MIKPSARWESILDKPGGKGPTGRTTKHKDDDGTLVARITARTGERFTSRSEKIAAESWTVRLLTEHEDRELGRVEGLPMAKPLHRQALQHLISLEYQRRARE